MTDRQETCEERIDAHLAGRVETIRLLMLAAQGGKEDWSQGELIELDGLGVMADGVIEEELAWEALNNLPLSISTKTVCTVLLSTGGPADMFEFEVEDGRIESSITYRFQDWFDGATRTLTDADGDGGEETEAWLESIAELVEVSQDA